MIATTQDRSDAHRSIRAWVSLGIIIFLYVVSFADRQIIALLVGPIKADLKLSDAQVGSLTGLAFSITYCIAGLPIGWMVDRHPRRWIIFAGTFFWSLAAMCTGFTRNFVQLLLVRAGVGIGEATLAPASFSLISDLFPRERLATALSFYTCGSSIGGGVAFAIGGLIIGKLTAVPMTTLPLLGAIPSWQAVFVVVGAPGLVFALLALLLTEPARNGPPGKDGNEPSFAEFARTLARRRSVLIPHFMGFTLLGLCAYVLIAWTPTWMMRDFGWGAARVGPLMGFTQAVVATSLALTGGFLTDRLYRGGLRSAHFAVPAITCSLGATICCFGLLLPTSAAGAFWMVALGAAVQGAYGGASFSSLQLVMPPRMRGRTSALYIFLLTLVGFGVGPVLVGFLTDHLFGRPEDIGKALALVVGCATVMAVSYQDSLIRTRRPMPEGRAT